MVVLAHMEVAVAVDVEVMEQGRTILTQVVVEVAVGVMEVQQLVLLGVIMVGVVPLVPHTAVQELSELYGLVLLAHSLQLIQGICNESLY
jgi:hypothetical protein